MQDVGIPSKRRLRELLASELGSGVSVDVVEDRDRIDIRISQHGGSSRPGDGRSAGVSRTERTRQRQQHVVGLKREIRDMLESRFGEDVRVEFVEDGNRIDVRVSNLGIVDAVEARHDDVSVTNYSEFRFTVLVE